MPRPPSAPQAATVLLARQADYRSESLSRTVGEMLVAAGFRPGPGDRVLVKPNLLKAANQGLPCTHPAVVQAACEYALDCGATVRVGDSPGFGSAVGVARRIGLAEALRGLDAPLCTLGRPTPLTLSFGSTVGLSRDALEADQILNLPKLKVHGQMRVTGAVKNLFGCVCGTRKAVAHTLHGDKGRRFEAMLIEIMEALPPTFSLLDGVTAMHAAGPIGGRPFALGLLGCSWSPVALDTAAWTILGLDPERVPLWREALVRDLAGTRPEDIVYPRERPEAFDATGFLLPEQLSPVTFHPLRLARSALKRAWARLW